MVGVETLNILDVSTQVSSSVTDRHFLYAGPNGSLRRWTAWELPVQLNFINATD